MKFLILIFVPLFLTAYAADDCQWAKDYDDERIYDDCHAEYVRELEKKDCVDCDKGWDFNEFVGIIANPAASVLSTWLVTDSYRDTQQYWADQYTAGQAACGERFDAYLDYNITRGGNPISAEDATSFVSTNCNGFSMNAYAGYNGMGATGWGSSYGMNGYLGAGYTPGMMYGMMGPNYGGIYNMSGGAGLGSMLALGLLGGGGISGGLNIGIGGGTGMMYPSGGGYSMMYPSSGGGYSMMYPSSGGGYSMTYPGGYNSMMYPGGGFNASLGIGLNPWSTGTGSYYNMNNQYYAQQQQYYQQQQQQYYQQQQQYYQQMQAQYQLNMDMNARAQGNQIGNYYADVALYDQYQSAAYDYYNNQSANYYYNSYNPYAMGNLQAGFSFGFGLGYQ